MTASVILSILALYSVGIILIISGVEALKRFKKNLSERYFGYGLICLGIVLGPLMGTRTVFGIQGYHSIDFSLAALNQLVLILGIAAFGFSFSYKIFSGKARVAAKIFWILVAVLLFGAWILALKLGAYDGPHVSRWGTEYEPTGFAKLASIKMVVFLALFNLAFLIRRLYEWHQKRKINYDFYIGLTFIVFLCFFIFEQLGQMDTWKLLFSRVVFNALAVTFFLLYTKESFKE